MRRAVDRLSEESPPMWIPAGEITLVAGRSCWVLEGGLHRVFGVVAPFGQENVCCCAQTGTRQMRIGMSGPSLCDGAEIPD